MVEDRITDGRRIAQLLASELDGREDGEFGVLSVTDADPDVEPTADGARAYDVVHDPSGNRLARTYVHPSRVHVEFERSADHVAALGREFDLRVRPKAVDPPRTLLFVEDGAAVKRAADVFEAVVEK